MADLVKSRDVNWLARKASGCQCNAPLDHRAYGIPDTALEGLPLAQQEGALVVLDGTRQRCTRCGRTWSAP